MQNNDKDCLCEFLKFFYYLLSEQTKTGENDDGYDPFMPLVRIGTGSTGSSRGAMEMTSGVSDVIGPRYDRPYTPPHQIRSTFINQDLLELLREEKQRMKST